MSEKLKELCTEEVCKNCGYYGIVNNELKCFLHNISTGNDFCCQNFTLNTFNVSNVSSIKDSGDRTQFETGAVRDMHEGKGRCDLLPLGVISDICDDVILSSINQFIFTGDKQYIYNVITWFSDKNFGNLETAILEVSKHYEQGCKKYGERNWEKGIPLHCYIDSAVRHYLKFKRGDDDEPHNRAFLWNLLGALWTMENKPELIDLPSRDPNKYMGETEIKNEG